MFFDFYILPPGATAVDRKLKSINPNVKNSVADPFHFDMDPDPDPRIRFVK